MVDARHLFDLTFWDDSGGSFMGLTRSQAKWLGLAILLVGLNLADFVTPIPNDVLNIALAAWLTTHWPIYSSATWLILTYTVIAWSLILLGAWIYPHHTQSLLNGYVNRFQRLLHTLWTRPTYLLLTVLALYVTYQLVGQVIAP